MIVRPADHVVVERADDLHLVRDRLPHELAAAEQPGLLARERREDDRRRLRVPGQQARRLEQRRRPRRVVVRARPDRDRVVVAADDVDQLRVDRSLERRDDVGGAARRARCAARTTGTPARSRTTCRCRSRYFARELVARAW